MDIFAVKYRNFIQKTALCYNKAVYVNPME